MKWFKLHNDIIHDPKLKVLAFEDRWHFVALMCLQNDGTLDEPEDILPELIAQCLGIHGPDLESLKERLIRVRLIDDDWRPRNWDKRQVSSDPTNAERQRRWKEKQRDRKLSNANNAVTVTDRPLLEEEEEKEKEVKEVKKVKKVKGEKKMLTVKFYDPYHVKGKGKEKGEWKGTWVEKEVSSDYEERFEEFYSLWPENRGRTNALTAYKKVKPAEHADICYRYLKIREWEDERFIPLPSSFINGKRWNDDLRNHELKKEYRKESKPEPKKREEPYV